MYNIGSFVQKAVNLINTDRRVRYTLYAALVLFLGYESFTLGTHFGEFAYYLIH